MSVTPLPTILVKKVDGTSVRMTLDELAASQTPAAPVASPILSSEEPSQQTPSFVSQKEAVQEDVIVTSPLSQKQDTSSDEIFLNADILPGAADHHKEESRAPLSRSFSEPIDHQWEISADDLIGATEHHREENASESSYSQTTALAPETTHALATTTPVTDIYKDMAASEMHAVEHAALVSAASDALPSSDTPLSTPKKSDDMVEWEKDDHVSLLDDASEEILAEAPHAPSSQQTSLLVEQVLARLSGRIPSGSDVSLKSLILSRMKDIRTNDQLVATMVRPKEMGGLSLKEEDAEEIIRVIEEVLSGASASKTEKPPVSRSEKKSMSLPPQVSASFSPPQEGSIPTMPARAVLAAVPPTRQASQGKPMLHDVVPPVAPLRAVSQAEGVAQKRTVGPVDEFLQLSLESVRRQGRPIEEIVDVLIRHMRLLQEESYLVYLQAKEAWKKSELSKRYQEVITGALREGLSIPQYVLKHTDTLTQEEFTAIVRFSGSI